MTGIKVTLAALLLLVSQVSGAIPIVVEFSFDADPAGFPWIGRGYAPGGVTGLLYGLQDNGANQTLTGVEFTSDTSPLGLTAALVGPAFQTGPGFTVTNGVVTAANLLFNFFDPAIGGLQIRFGYTDGLSPLGANVLHWNGGSGPVKGMGNIAGGFEGATYGPRSVPEPGTLSLLCAGLLGLVSLLRRRVT